MELEQIEFLNMNNIINELLLIDIGLTITLLDVEYKSKATNSVMDNYLSFFHIIYKLYVYNDKKIIIKVH